jgi:uncharacterized membrane protein HdeD (DUF308 family)
MEEMNVIDEVVEKAERLLGRMWKVTIFRGTLGLAFGVALLVWPGIGLTTLLVLFGAFSLVWGLALVVEAIAAELETSERVLLAIEGLLGVTVGVVVVLWPSLSALGLLYAIAAFAIAIGLFEIVLAFELPLTGERSLLLGLNGLLSTAFGVVMFARPGAGAVALLALIAAFALITGVMQIALGVELRRVAHEVMERLHPKPTAKPAAQG